MTTATIAQDQEQVDQEVGLYRKQFAETVSMVLFWSVAIVTGVVLVLWLFLSYVQLLIVGIGLALLVVGAGLFPTLSRHGRANLAVAHILIAILLLAVVTPVLMPALTAVVHIAYVVVVLLTYLLLGDRAGRWMAGAAILGMVTNVLFRIWLPDEWLLSLSRNVTLAINGPVSVLALLVAIVIVRQVTLDQERSFRQAKRANLEIERQALSEQKLRQKLQETVERYVAYMNRVSQGDLTARLLLAHDAGSSVDPLIVLGHSLNDTVSSLHRMTLQTQEAARQLLGASSEILTASAQQARAASEQSSAIAQASSTIDEIRAIAEQTTRRAQAVTGQAQRTAAVSRAGHRAVSETIAGVSEIRERVERIAHDVLILSDQAQSIGQIIAAVSGLAKQSNMLALNAAVEAARAGKVGAGFAVVAQEVRSLANQSRMATGKVEQILVEIQRGVNKAVMATEDGMKGADLGVSLAREGGLSIQELTESVTESVQVASQIAVAAGQQLAGMDQIAQAMQSIDQATLQNVTGAQQSERAAQDLNRLAEQLREVVEQYTL
jgi:methyl-accepting chemotaxis protein